MSSSDTPAASFPLHVTAGKDDLITIFDGRGQVMARDVNVCQASLPRGVYTIRSQFQDAVQDRVVRLEQPENLVAHAPQAFSAMPYFGSATAHEYYSYTSSDWSKKDTRPPIGPPPFQSRLMLFVRTLDKDAGQKSDLLKGCSLLNSEGQVISRLSDDETWHDPSVGYATLSAPAAPGVYRLRSVDNEAREVIVALFSSWSTSCFILFHDALHLDTMAMSMAEVQRGFDPNDRASTIIDLGLWSLQNGVTAFPRYEMSELLLGKFQNPLSGLIGLHLLLRRPDTKPEQVQFPLNFLQGTLPDSADVRALALIAAKKWPAQFKMDVSPLTTSPMLRASAEAIIEAAASDAHLLPADSLLSRAAPYRFSDSPWFMWNPTQLLQKKPPAPPRPKPRVNWPASGGVLGMQVIEPADTHDVMQEIKIIVPDSTLDWVDLGILDRMTTSTKRKRDDALTLESIASSLRLPAGTVETRLDRLHNLADSGLLTEFDGEKLAPSVIDLLLRKAW